MISIRFCEKRVGAGNDFNSGGEVGTLKEDKMRSPIEEGGN